MSYSPSPSPSPSPPPPGLLSPGPSATGTDGNLGNAVSLTLAVALDDSVVTNALAGADALLPAAFAGGDGVSGPADLAPYTNTAGGGDSYTGVALDANTGGTATDASGGPASGQPGSGYWASSSLINGATPSGTTELDGRPYAVYQMTVGGVPSLVLGNDADNPNQVFVVPLDQAAGPSLLALAPAPAPVAPVAPAPVAPAPPAGLGVPPVMPPSIPPGGPQTPDPPRLLPSWWARLPPLSEGIGPSSPLGQWFANDPSMSLLQNDRALADMQLVAGAVSIGALTVATGGIAGELAGGALAGTGATAFETAAITSTASSVGGGAMFRYGTAAIAAQFGAPVDISTAAAWAFDPDAMTSDALTGAAFGVGGYGIRSAAQAWSVSQEANAGSGGTLSRFLRDTRGSLRIGPGSGSVPAAGPGELAPGARVSSNTKGIIGEELVKFLNSDLEHVADHVYFYSSSGVEFTADSLFSDASGRLVAPEAKLGPYARLSAPQVASGVFAGGGGWHQVVLVGNSAVRTGLPAGEPVWIYFIKMSFDFPVN